MTFFETFFWGFAGSLSVEIVTIYQMFQSESFDVPVRYKIPLFWLARVGLAVVAGGLAIVYRIDNPLIAVNIGAATPLIMRALSQGYRSSRVE